MIINGELNGYFCSSTCLRQGCPISLYLFTIIMDVLSYLLEVTIGNSRANGSHLGVSHLIYVDDILLFGKANLSTSLGLNVALTTFKEASNIGVNITKSTICFSKSVDSMTQCQIANIYDFIATPLPWKYLGIMTSSSRLHRNALVSWISYIYGYLLGRRSSSLLQVGSSWSNTQLGATYTIGFVLRLSPNVLGKQFPLLSTTFFTLAMVRELCILLSGIVPPNLNLMKGLAFLAWKPSIFSINPKLFGGFINLIPY